MKKLKEYGKFSNDIVIYFLSFLKVSIFVIKTLMFMFIINNLLKKDFKGLLITIGIEFLIGLISSTVDYIYFTLREKYAELFKLDIIKELSYRLTLQSNKDLQDREKYISWFVTDINTLKNSYFITKFQIAICLLTIIFSSSMLLWFNKYIFLFNIMGTILMFLISNILTSKIENVEYVISRAKEKNTEYIVNLYSNVYKFFFANKMINFAVKSDEYNEKYLDEFIENKKKLNAVICMLNLTSILVQVLNGSIVILFIVQDKLSISTFVPLSTFAAYFCSNMGAVVRMYMTFVNSKKLYKKYENMQIQDESLDNIEDINIIEFKNICLNEVLYNFNFEIKKGSKYLIIGPSGSGKSSIINLLLKNIEDYTGDVLINGKNIKSINKEAIYSKIEYINSDNFVFYSSIYDNISLYDKKCKKEEIDKILVKLGLDEIDKNIDDNLSLGQKLRVNLARIEYYNSSIVILDEATSNLDVKNREKIEKELLNSDKTLILITHHYDDKYIEQFDRVIKLQKVGDKNENK